ncbi:MAG: DUF559 domain-containing protein, partial [Chitinophagaceae bacterium]
MNKEDTIGNLENASSGGLEYDFRRIEKAWQQQWKETNAYKVFNPEPGEESVKPKFYVLDMFPYPSGAGLHVGHPLGYIASDIYSRFKKLKGFNVLHPMGFDSFGLPAEQYALDTGQHPAETTKKNIATFKSQLDNIGFCYDWSREVQTSDPNYYKWTQWIFLQLFNSFFCNTEKKALPISLLIKKYETKGATPKSGPFIPGKHFTAEQWNGYSKQQQEEILMNRRLAFSKFGEVNWCEALGTVLANDEVINGVSERGGHPVEKKKMRQWYLRITSYADRLLEGLETVDFSDSMKEMQRNWIGKSSGAEIDFEVRLTPNPSPHGEGGTSTRFFQTVDKSYWEVLKKYGRENRKNATEAEDILWQRLRNKKLGVKVRRQHAIQGYIVDFALLEVKLAVEVDGEYHSEQEQQLYDEARTKFLKQYDIDVIRFTNEEVIQDSDNVIKRISKEIEQRKAMLAQDADAPPSPSPTGEGRGEATLSVYTTRPDTIFGVDFMVLAPEHVLVAEITTTGQKEAIDNYLQYVKSRSDRERQAEVKQITGCFTGSFAINPFDGRQIPIWIAEYVLAGYGTGAIMAVPCGDQRDYAFAKHFNIPITNIIGDYYNGEEANPTKEAILQNSGFLNGLLMKDAIEVAINKIEDLGIGKRQVNYKMRDAGFSRQRYWGEPFPIKWINGNPYPLDESELPFELPHVDNYKPGPNGQGPLANIPDWVNKKVKLSAQPESEVSPLWGDLEGAVGEIETSTMPGYAGSSWYFLRFMDPHNNETFCDRKVSDYWNQVDLYIGGTEHAVGHLLYSRMWTKVLFDLGFIGFDEPFKKLLNQGMIQGSSRFVFRVHGKNTFVSNGLKDNYQFDSIHVDVNMVDGNELDTNAFKKWKPEFANAEFILEDGKYICGSEVEKMSKSKFNTVNPDDLVLKYGADTFRMYEMFLGPVEMSKPWDTKGIEGVHRFLKKFWRLFADETKGLIVTDEEPTAAELKVLH